MKKAREIMIHTMEKHSEGNMPNAAALTQHKLGHSIAQNQFAEAAMIRETGNAELVESLIRANDMLAE